MNVFVDTNVVAETFLMRENVADAKAALDAMVVNDMTGYISVQSFCTLIYLLERRFKSEGICNPERLESVREKMNVLLDIFHIADIDSVNLRMGINDGAFTDLEDSCQYQAARKSGCKILLTFNCSDFKGCGDDIMVMSPSDFVRHFQ